MKKIVYGVLATLSGLVLLFSYRTSLGEEITPAAADEAASVNDTTSTTTVPQVATPTPTPTPTTTEEDAAAGTATTASGLVDGTYTGQSASTRFGPVQVALTVSGGQITAVDVVDYPDSNSRDRQINERAIPQLVSETLDAQSADIDMVSGATYTSDGYLQSLQSAIDQAQS